MEKKVLLHTCCAPCATSVVERLKEDGFRINAFFYNPNIHPKKEYELRVSEIKELAKIEEIELNIGNYDIKEWFDMAKPHADLSEGGYRCELCYEMRLRKTAELAVELGIDNFTTTLTVSPYKNFDIITGIGKDIAKEFRIKYLEYNFKKKDGFKRSVELSKKYNFYRQDYCGCVYSMLEVQKKREKKENKNK